MEFENPARGRVDWPVEKHGGAYSKFADIREILPPVPSYRTPLGTSRSASPGSAHIPGPTRDFRSRASIRLGPFEGLLLS
jgi:hypothetical protein